MDLSNVDMNALARQLRHPEGEYGKRVGEAMAANNAPFNVFAVELLDIRPSDHVLEIGFGPGEALADVIRLTPQGWVAGIDSSEEMLKMAEKRNHRALMQEHVELTLGYASELPYPDEMFDKVFAVNVMHFWPAPLTELGECLRVLKPGGKALLYVTHPSSWPAGLQESGVCIAREPADAESLLRHAGFSTVETRKHTFAGGNGYAVTGVR